MLSSLTVTEPLPGKAQCILVRCYRCQPGKFVHVKEDQLLARVDG